MQKSASLSIVKFPLFIFKILAGLQVKARIILFSFTVSLWYSSSAYGSRVSIPDAPVEA